MPWEIVKSGDRWNVVKKGTREVKGSHESRGKAVRQLRALYMHYGEKKR